VKVVAYDDEEETNGKDGCDSKPKGSVLFCWSRDDGCNSIFSEEMTVISGDDHVEIGWIAASPFRFMETITMIRTDIRCYLSTY
jgi:hypothetical protein